LSTEAGWAYEVLGVKPGVSDRELKAAHRDLAKVWHPDRFLNDPRLQEKAQEKLKEINAAYEQLISRHAFQPARPKRKTSATKAEAPIRSSEQRVREQRTRWLRVVAALAVFVAVFAFTMRTLIRQRLQAATPAPVENSSVEVAGTTTAETKPVVRSRGDNNVTAGAAVVSEPVPTPQTVNPVPTVTVSIDPANGLLATPECPVKTRVTYPSGSEPHAYCNIAHVVKPEKPSGLKGLAKRISDL
jgi:hypothetical protein